MTGSFAIAVLAIATTSVDGPMRGLGSEVPSAVLQQPSGTAGTSAMRPVSSQQPRAVGSVAPVPFELVTPDVLVADATTPAAPSPLPTAADLPSPRPSAPRPAVPVATPQPVRTSSAPPAIAVATAAPTCPADWFCYPRVGVSGPIVVYADCSGGSDIGSSIRAFACLSPRYLLGHAYTPFGRIVSWRAGDVVYAYGQAFTITGALTARSCEPPPLPLAPLSLQTSLSADVCGPVLIVQGR